MSTDPKLALFIAKARAVHGDRYDYSESVYTGARFKIQIRCRVHGTFEQLAGHHTTGHGCRDCHYSNATLTTREFIQASRKVHGKNTYDYSKTNYTGNSDKITIICRVHGSFQQTPKAHLYQKSGCQQCANLARSTYGVRRIDYKKRLAKLRSNITFDDHGQRGADRTTFNCLTCGHSWESTLHQMISHRKYGCPMCAAIHTGYARSTVILGGKKFRVQGNEPIALEWMVKTKGIDPHIILTGRRVPRFTYLEGGRTRTYIPDFYLPPQNRIVEVKSNYTMLGRREWLNNLKRKRRSVLKEGYTFSLLVYDKKGTRLQLPETWHKQPYEVLSRLLF